MPYLTVNKTQG